LKVEFFKHGLGRDEKEKILECLDGIFLTTGSYVSEFETNFARYTGLDYAVGLTSCTAALHLSLLAMGIGSGDEVITTPMTFIATATAVIHTGAHPVFVDVEPHTGLIDPSKIEAAITPRTKAIIPVHLYGQMCDMKKIKAVADKHGLKIIEDAAHCIEGERDGIRPGQLGDSACFSFYATKNITCGEGGAVATRSEDLGRKVLMLRQHGMSSEAADRHKGNYRHWDMVECGWKYNMDNIRAALLLPQLEKIDSTWKKRADLWEKYVRVIEKIPGIRCPEIATNSKSALHLFTIWVDKDKRDHILRKLGENGVGATVNYRAIHLLSYFAQNYGFEPGAFPIAEHIGDSTISLPFYPGMSDSNLSYVADTLRKIVN